jgi:hypothetical protein
VYRVPPATYPIDETMKIKNDKSDIENDEAAG